MNNHQPEESSFQSFNTRRRQPRQRSNDYYGGRANNNNNPYRGRQPHMQQKSGKQQLLLLLGMGGLLVTWFMTPLSEWVVNLILLSVPIEADLEMGQQALASLPYRQVPDRWGVKEIGYDLIQTFCSSSSSSQNNDFTNSFTRNSKRELCSAHGGNNWSFGVIHADFANAFALPGGIIRVTDTLLHQLQLSNGEIAALLGHEMGHVIHRHSQARLVEKKILSFLVNALVYEDHDDHRETFGEAIGELLLQSASFLGEQKFSRRDEYQADEMAWNLLVSSQTYKPTAVKSLLSKLWSTHGGSGETSWESTHPGTKDRISALEEKWNDLSRKQQRKLKMYPVN